MVGDGHQPHSRVLYTHYKNSLAHNTRSLDPGSCDLGVLLFLVFARGDYSMHYSGSDVKGGIGIVWGPQTKAIYIYIHGI